MPSARRKERRAGVSRRPRGKQSFFSIRDLDLFPSLQGHDPQMAYDAFADELGTFSFSDTVTIRVSTPPPAEGGYIYHMSRDIVLVDGPNYLEFYFVPDDSTGVFITSP
jgi:hypothetical protein